MVVDIGVARVLTHHTAAVNSLDFTKDGDRLLSSGDDNRLCLYSSTQGTMERVAQCSVVLVLHRIGQLCSPILFAVPQFSLNVIVWLSFPSFKNSLRVFSHLASFSC